MKKGKGVIPMKYGKKISAMLALAMLISSSTSFAAVADVNVDEVILSDEAVAAEAELSSEALDEFAVLDNEDDEIVDVAAEKATITVTQAEHGTIEIANTNSASEFLFNMPTSASASDILSDNDYFILTAPAEIVTKTEKAATFNNPNVGTNAIEFRLSGPEKIFVYNAVKSGTITLYAKFNNNKTIECQDISEEPDASTEVKYLPDDTMDAGSGDSVFGYVTFEVKEGRAYNLYARGGTGRLFAVMFTGIAEGGTTESLKASVGDEIAITVKPDAGYIVKDILIDGVSVSNKDTHTFKVTKDSEVSAVYGIDPATEVAIEAFENFTLPSEVTEDLELPSRIADGYVKLTWESSNEQAMTSEGKITKKVGVDVPVTLTATAVINNFETRTKTFDVTVKQYDVQAELDKAEITLPETISEDFKVPAKFLDTNIVWTVDETKYITFAKEADDDGNITATVTNPYFVEGDKPVVITATIEGTEASRSFNATVLKNENTEEASTAKFVAERLELEDSENGKISVTENIDLPTTDETYGGTITWKSSNPNIVSTSGVVKRQSTSKTVILTAIVEIDGMKATKEFTVVVEAKKSSTSGGGGGGGSYSSGYSPSTGSAGVVGTYTEYNDIVSDANINTNIESEKFNDLGDYAWAVPHINRLVNNSIVKGVGGGRFDPSGLVTREQFATMIVRAFDFKEGTTMNAKKFDDVVSDEYYSEAVSILSSMGIIKGQSETKFGVGESITRQDMAVMCALASKLNVEKEVSEFNDAASISDYAIDAVKQMQKAGVLDGDENNNFNPLANATRAEAAKVISVILDIMD